MNGQAWADFPRLRRPEDWRSLPRFGENLLTQQISLESVYYSRCWRFKVKLITVLHSEQSLSAYDTNFDTMLGIAWTVKVLHRAL